MNFFIGYINAFNEICGYITSTAFLTNVKDLSAETKMLSSQVDTGH